MLAPLLTIALGALVMWALWSVARPRPAFVVRITSGVPRVTSGTVTPAFLAEIAEVCRRHEIQRGTVNGVVRDRRISLAFSGSITPASRQQLRNLWSLSGWSAGR